jgi:hypothetical protein
MNEITTHKRPASHRWAIGIFGFMTVGYAVFLLDIFRGRDGATLSPYWERVAFLSVGAIAFVALIFGRRKWAYYVASWALAIWSARGFFSFLQYAHYFVVHGDLGWGPHFHLAERDQPFVESQKIPVSELPLMGLAIGLLIWLFVRFAFGIPSRRYYGFQDGQKT